LIVVREDPKTCPKCGGPKLAQETDVLDTWFSSGLFPFSTLGWPEKTPDLACYYPNDVMMTGFDIIFFWVARMIMLGMRFGGDVPFRTVFINGLVRDENGEKMSKTRGNDVDPLAVIEKHGTDALRFTLAALANPGNDPSLGEARLIGYKAFVNKLWNASRFVLMNLEGDVAPSFDRRALPLPSRWILEELDATAREVNAALTEFRFDRAANALYHFLWDEFCDWYLEISKAYLADATHAPAARAVLLRVLDGSLRLLHPFMPFVTEEIWQKLPHDGPTIMKATFPTGAEAESGAAAEMTPLMELVIAIRTIRAEKGVDPKRRIDLSVVAPATRSLLDAEAAWIRSLGRIARLEILSAPPPETPQTIKQQVGPWQVLIPMAGLFDLEAERARLGKERHRLEAERGGIAQKFENPQFALRAKPELVAEGRARLAEIDTLLEKNAVALRGLGAS
jgi:valyl-tRNA synthetase